MGSITVRSLSQTTHKRLKARAARNGRTLEAEVRRILEETVSSKKEAGVGSQLAALGRSFGGIELTITRDKTPAEPVKFE
jgi:antitoxin FitA